ncbi:hypothetical protein E2C01_071601 [Portunus trituberculatus]|uniref:Uncharacterized protein n=1 Tax=Portunus trituberculatus TaxID=210409 RepID=A0A5B7I8M6_PORTR|nr:hypothetical protein [Portunus trituberculatus]
MASFCPTLFTWSTISTGAGYWWRPTLCSSRSFCGRGGKVTLSIFALTLSPSRPR